MDFRGLLDELKIDYLEEGHSHARSGWIQLRECPFCGSGNYHLGYRIGSKYFNCWRCAWHSAYSVLRAIDIPPRRIREFLDSFDEDGSLAKALSQERGELVEPKGRDCLLKAHRAYLKARGFDPAKLEQMWSLEGIDHLGGRLQWRIYIPITFKDKRVSWTTRAIGNRVEQRYISASAQEESINHKRLLYGFDYVTHTAIAVEGPTDVWAIGPGAVGTFGTAYSTAQVRLLAAVPNRFVCFDSSTDAQRNAKKLCSELALFPGSTTNIVLDAKDPGSAKRKEIATLRRVTKL